MRKHVGIMEAARICGKSYTGFRHKVELGQVPYFMDGTQKRFYVDELMQEAVSACHIKSTKDRTARTTTRMYPSGYRANPNTNGLALTPLSAIKP